MHDNPTEWLKDAHCRLHQTLSAGETPRTTPTEVVGEVHQGLLIVQGTCPNTTTIRTHSTWVKDMRFRGSVDRLEGRWCEECGLNTIVLR